MDVFLGVVRQWMIWSGVGQHIYINTYINVYLNTNIIYLYVYKPHNKLQFLPATFASFYWDSV